MRRKVLFLVVGLCIGIAECFENRLQGPNTIGLIVVSAQTGQETGSVFPRTSKYQQGDSWSRDAFLFWLQSYLAMNVYGVGCTSIYYEQNRPRNTTTSMACPEGVVGDVTVFTLFAQEYGPGPRTFAIPFSVTATTQGGVESRDLCMSRNDQERLRYAASQFGFNDITFTCDVGALNGQLGTPPMVGCSCGAKQTSTELSVADYISQFPNMLVPLSIGLGLGLIVSVVVVAKFGRRNEVRRDVQGTNVEHTRKNARLGYPIMLRY